MPQKLEQIVAEIVRVAKELECEPIDVPRAKFKQLSPHGESGIEQLGGWGKIKRDAFGHERPPELQEKRGVELRTNYVRGLERKLGDAEYLAERLRAAILEAFERNPVRISGLRKHWDKIDKKPTKRVLVAVFSDLHYGLVVDPTEVQGNAYNWTIAARRTARLVEQIATWKPEHRAETELQILLLGDVVHGAIHAISEGTATLLAEQVQGASQILTSAIDALRHHFKRIRIKSASGNHDRHVHRGGRAVSAKWDSLATMVAGYLQAAFRACDDVTIDVPRTPYVTFDLPGGALGFATHGDTVLASGNVGRVVHVEKIAQRVYAFDASGVLPKPIDVVCMGHVHVPLLSALPNGASLVINGCMPGTDAFAQSIGILSALPSQVIFESVEGHPVGDFRVVRLAAADAVAEYDDVIAPPVFA